MSAIKELENEQVRHLDLSRYCRVERGTPVRDALALMRRERCRAVLVTEGEQLVGIFTERDVMRRVVLDEVALDGPVEAVMTHNPITVAPETSAAAALWLMDDHHFRNLPVVDVAGPHPGRYDPRRGDLLSGEPLSRRSPEPIPSAGTISAQSRRGLTFCFSQRRNHYERTNRQPRVRI